MYDDITIMFMLLVLLKVSCLECNQMPFSVVFHQFISKNSVTFLTYKTASYVDCARIILGYGLCSAYYNTSTLECYIDSSGACFSETGSSNNALIIRECTCWVILL